MKLSKAQTELLDYIRNGGKVYWMTGLDAYAFRHDQKRINRLSLDKLEDKGLIRKVNENWTGWQYESIETTQE